MFGGKTVLNETAVHFTFDHLESRFISVPALFDRRRKKTVPPCKGGRCRGGGMSLMVALVVAVAGAGCLGDVP